MKQALDQYAVIKVDPSFHKWLKVFAAQNGTSMVRQLENLCARAIKGRPWEKK